MYFPSVRGLLFAASLFSCCFSIKAQLFDVPEVGFKADYQFFCNGDFDGDGRDEFLIHDGTARIRRPDPFNPAQIMNFNFLDPQDLGVELYPGSNGSYSECTPCDINGDGKDEVFFELRTFNSQETRGRVFYGIAANTALVAGEFDWEGRVYRTENFSSSITKTDRAFQRMDVNADGSPDVVWSYRVYDQNIQSHTIREQIIWLQPSVDWPPAYTEVPISDYSTTGYSNGPVTTLTPFVLGNLNQDNLPDLVGQLIDAQYAELEPNDYIRAQVHLLLKIQKPDHSFDAVRIPIYVKNFPDTAYETFPAPFVFADLNNDGITDVIAPNDYTNNVEVRLGPAFEIFQTLAFEHRGDSIPIDWDRDGKIDIVHISRNAPVEVMLQSKSPGDPRLIYSSSAGRFTFPDSNGYNVIDLDERGLPEIINALGGDHNVYVNPTTRWTEVTKQPISDYYGYWNDLDSDGDLDAWKRDSNNDDMIIAKNLSGPSFPATKLLTNQTDARELVSGDMNHDGRPELIVANTAGRRIHITPVQPGNPVNYQFQPPAAQPFSLALGDIDHDGDLDIVSGHQGANGLHWHANNGSGTGFTSRVIDASRTDVNAVAVGDVDADGDFDVVAGSAGQSEIALYRNNGANPPVFTREQLFDGASGVRTLLMADIDNDSDLDIIFAAGGLPWLTLNRDGSLHDVGTASLDQTGNPFRTRDLAVGDLNGDGLLDVAVAAAEGDTLIWYANHSTQDSPDFEFHELATNLADLGARGIAISDIDADGRQDIAYVCYWNGKPGAAWLQNTPESIKGFRWRVIDTRPFSELNSLVAGDFDGDGDQDLAVSTGGEGSVARLDNLYPTQAVWNAVGQAWALYP